MARPAARRHRLVAIVTGVSESGPTHQPAAERHTLLVTISGEDRPGVTSTFFDAIADVGAEVLDLEQVVVRGGAGWMREMAGWGTYAEDGAIGDLGLGVKYWWHTRARDDTGRLALRVDARLAGRAGGIVIGARTFRVAPLVAAGLDLAW